MRETRYDEKVREDMEAAEILIAAFGRQFTSGSAFDLCAARRSTTWKMCAAQQEHVRAQRCCAELGVGNHVMALSKAYLSNPVIYVNALRRLYVSVDDV